MLLDGPSHAAKHTNISSSLRRVLSTLARATPPATPPAWRTFSTIPAQRQFRDVYEDGKDGRASKKTQSRPSDKSVKHIYPHGRIIGSPGRRQRASRHKLAINSLGKSSNIVVLDAVDEAIKAEVAPIAPAETPQSSEEVVLDLLQDSQHPLDTDILESIEELRPQDSYLDEQEFNALAQRLSHAYNRRQLLQYYRHSRQQFPVEENADDVPETHTTSIWQKGRTPLENRLPLQPNALDLGKKDSVIEQIIRNVWMLSVHSEEQELGEQEVTLPTQYLSQLLTVVPSDNGSVPTWQTLLSSPLLVRSVQLEILPEASILRVTGRRHDTSQVIQELCTKADSLYSIILTLDMLKSLSASGDTEAVLGPETVDEIRQKTMTSISRLENGDFVIAGFEVWQCQLARAMIYELLDVKGSATTQTLLEDRPPQKRQRATDGVPRPVFVPAFFKRPITGSMIPQRSRLAVPVPKGQADDATTSHGSRALLERLQENVADVDATLHSTFSILNVRMPRPRPKSRWKAHIGLVLQNSGSPRVATSFVPQPLFQDAMLESFAPWLRKYDGPTSFQTRLVAHLVPIHTTTMMKLPSFELSYSPDPMSGRFLFAILTTKVATHQIHIPLPDKCADLQLGKDVFFSARQILPFLANWDTGRLLRVLTQTVETQGSQISIDAMQQMVPPEPLLLRLPYGMLPKETQAMAGEDGLKALYTVSHFELSNTTRYLPSKSAAPELSSWQNDTYLSIHDSDAGVFGGRQRQISVAKMTAAMKGERPGNGEQPSIAADLKVQASAATDAFKSASCLIDLMTSMSRQPGSLSQLNR